MPVTAGKRDYYEVLGVDRRATRDQLKQAYRQLALHYHPDRNHAPDAADKFREIAEAYAVLSDETKRRAYDATGHAGVEERWTTEDLFRDFQFGDFFGGRFGDLSGLFGDFFGRRVRPGAHAARGLDLHYDLDVTLEEAARGGEFEIHVTRSQICATCGGNGAKPGTAPKAFEGCGGSGQKQQVQTGKGVRMVTLSTCARCEGRGIMIESPCASCRGKGIQFAPHTYKVKVPPGVDDGMGIRLAGQGEPNADGGSPGDLLIRPHVKPHPVFERRGDDLYMMTRLSLSDAALGSKIQVRGLNGDVLDVAIPPGTQGGTAFRVNGKGMPRLGKKGKGDLYVLADVRTPTDLTRRQRTLLQEFAKLEAEKGSLRNEARDPPREVREDERRTV